VMVYCGAYPLRKPVPKQEFPAGICSGAGHSRCPYFNEARCRFSDEVVRQFPPLPASPPPGGDKSADGPPAKTLRERRRRLRLGLRQVSGFLLHPGFFYHRGHTWVMPCAAGRARIGLDDFGVRLAQGLRRVSLPLPSALVRQGEVAVTLDCREKRGRLLSPVDGVVEAVNEDLVRDPSALVRDPYGDGWLFEVKLHDDSFAELPTGSAAAEWLRRDADRLSLLLHEDLGATAADGGDLVPNPAAMLSREQWDTIVEMFFLASTTK
jgi:glycine cleavage system H lipoate-binding protein